MLGVNFKFIDKGKVKILIEDYINNIGESFKLDKNNIIHTLDI